MIAAVKQRERSDRVSGGLDGQIAKHPRFSYLQTRPRMQKSLLFVSNLSKFSFLLIKLFCLHYLSWSKFRLVAGCQKGLIFMRIALIASRFESFHNARTNKRFVGWHFWCWFIAFMFFPDLFACRPQDLFSISAYVYAQKPQLDIHSFEGNFTRVRKLLLVKEFLRGFV